MSLMHEHLQKQLSSVASLSDIELIMFAWMASHRQTHPRLGYVAGTITADGPEHMQANIQKLLEHTYKLRDVHTFPLFSAPDVFTGEVYKRINAHTLSSKDFQPFWRNILREGHITDIFMTPRWELSGGATDEHNTAKELGITIHYIDDKH